MTLHPNHQRYEKLLEPGNNCCSSGGIVLDTITPGSWLLNPGSWAFRPLIRLSRPTPAEAFRIFLYPGGPDRALYALRLPPVARVRLPP